MHTKNLLAGMVICCGLTVPAAAQQPASVARDVSAEQFRTDIDQRQDEQLLDVRTPREWQSGVIGGAVLADITAAGFAEKADRLDRKRPVLVYCHSGGRSRRAMAMLQEMGFREIYNLTGGITAWRAKGFATVAPAGK